jgi:hypothetical protein
MAKVDLVLKRDKRKGQLFDQGMIVPTAIEVGDGAGDFQDAIVGAGAEVVFGQPARD